MKGNRFLPIVAALALLVGPGCPDTYKVETILHPDGSVERSILQKRDTVPEAARSDRVWSSIAGKDLGPNQNEFFDAKGRFKFVEEIPDHFVRKAPEGSGLADGKLVREYRRNDYVLVTEHIWRETLTDSWSYDGMRKAREELADLMIDLGSEVFDEVLGKDYDAADLVAWAKKEGKTWLTEITDECLMVIALRKEADLEKTLETALQEKFAAICARHGLVLKADGKFLEKEDLDKAGQEFIIGLIARHVRDRKTGQPLDREVASAWILELKKKDEKAQPSRFEAAADTVVERKFGGKEALERRGNALIAQIAGLYLQDLFMAPGFECRLTIPGVIVETNGLLVADGTISWKFSSQEAFPLGRPMTCRSLASDAELQDVLFKGRPLESRKAMLDTIEIVTGDEGLLGALRSSREEKTLAPLRAYGKQNQAKVDALLRLLKVEDAK